MFKITLPASYDSFGTVQAYLLDPCASRIIEADDRRPDVQCLVHDLAYLLRIRLAQTSTEDCEVLRKDENAPIRRSGPMEIPVEGIPSVNAHLSLSLIESWRNI